MADPVPAAFSLDPGIDAEALRAEFAINRRVQIEPFLAGDGAARLREHLEAREDWQLILKPKAGRAFEVSAREFAEMSPAQRRSFESLARPAAEDGMRYLYERISLSRRTGDAPGAGCAADDIVRLIASPAVLDLLSTVTGATDLKSVEAQATRYAPAHFLTVHDDVGEGADRRVAFVLGLTDGWRPEWGGLLLFHDERGDVIRGFVPRSNALTLFTVPQKHSVSFVPPFARGPRYAISGWLLSKSDS